MNREIRPRLHLIQNISVPESFLSKPLLALSEQARLYGLQWLLAHADDGVIWGELRQGELHLSCDAFPEVSPLLRIETLQQVRLFGHLAELLMWRDESTWRVRLIQDDAGELHQYYDEANLLWGTDVDRKKDGFVLLYQGKEGLRHAPPLASADSRPRLKVRHYIAYDRDGQAYIAHSRLVSFGGEE
jgi:CRISPR-associated protein (TIGR03984 family)